MKKYILVLAMLVSASAGAQTETKNCKNCKKMDKKESTCCKAETEKKDCCSGKVDFSVWPKGSPNTAYAQYFIGNSFTAPMDAENGGPVNVTFEPRCRNNWHIHHKAVQVLICVAGKGWYQEWGKEPVQMVPGTVIAIPAETKHWHGAAKDSWFQHLTYHIRVEEGSSNEWLEPVGDDVYDKLP